MSDRRTDRADRLTAAAAERDLLPLRQRQTAALQATARRGANPTGRDQPPGALLAIVPRSASATATGQLAAVGLCSSFSLHEGSRGYLRLHWFHLLLMLARQVLGAVHNDQDDRHYTPQR